MAHPKISMKVTPEWVMAGKDIDDSRISVGGLAHRLGWLEANKKAGQPLTRKRGKTAKSAVPSKPTKRFRGKSGKINRTRSV